MKSLVVLFLLAALTAEGRADTVRMQKVVSQLGIDEAESAESKAAAEAVDRLVDIGLKAHPRMQARAAQVQEARANVDAAQGGYQPKIGLTASGIRSRTRDMNSDSDSNARQASGYVTLTENIWRGGQDAGLVDIARQDEELALIQQLNEQEYLNFSIRRAALDFNYETLHQAIDEASAADATDLRSLTERKFGANQVGKIDIHLSSMRESQAKASAARGTTQAQQAYQRLLGLLGPGSVNEAVEKDIQSLTRKALPYPATQPALAGEKPVTLAEKSSIAVQKRADVTLDQNYRGRFLPSLDFVGTWGRTNGANWLEDESNRLTSQTQDNTLELRFSWTIWDRTQDYRIRAAAANKTAATAELDAARYQAETETRRLQAYIKDLHQTLGISREAYAAAGQLYDSQRKLYESGVIGLQAVMDAEREKRLALSAWQENVYQLQLSLLQWQALQRGYLSGAGVSSASVSQL